MKVVEYKIETIDFRGRGSTINTRGVSLIVRAELVQKLFSKMGNDGWVYKEELRFGDNDFLAYVFFKYDESFLEYNKELLTYLRP